MNDPQTVSNDINAKNVFLLPLALSLGAPLAVSAADPAPDVKGKWVGKTSTIIAGGGAHWPSSAGTFDKPGLYAKDLTIEISGQTDRRIWGKAILSGGGEKTEEPFIGHLHGKDGRKLLYADKDGYLTGDFDGDVLTFCYAHAGGPSQTSVVSCTEVKRSR